MGTTKDWVMVLVTGGLFCGGMILLGGWRREYIKAKPALIIPIYALGGLGFGVLTTFHGQALRWPLVLVTASVLICFIGIVVVGLYRARLLHQK